MSDVLVLLYVAGAVWMALGLARVVRRDPIDRPEWPVVAACLAVAVAFWPLTIIAVMVVAVSLVVGRRV